MVKGFLRVWRFENMKQFVLLDVDEKVTKDEIRAGLVLLRDSIEHPGIQIRVQDIEHFLKPKHAKAAIDAVHNANDPARRALNGSLPLPKLTRWQRFKMKLGFGPSILMPKGFKRNW
jgi:hypothetical protein